MTFTVNTLTRCTGQSHYTMTVTIASVQYTIKLSKDEAEYDPPANVVEAREKIIDRAISACKEAGATTFAQMKTAIEGNTYKV